MLHGNHYKPLQDVFILLLQLTALKDSITLLRVSRKTFGHHAMG